MCSVSVLHDYMARQVPTTQWTRPVFEEYKEIIKRLDALDGKLSQPECDNAPKTAWMDDVERRLGELETIAFSAARPQRA
jgi:hypothetical protein